MSKLIRKLANEARIEVGQRIGYNDRDREEAFEVEFAKLIVRECAGICFSNWRDNGDSYGLLIKEHFGISDE
jgi:hypothetical protein